MVTSASATGVGLLSTSNVFHAVFSMVLLAVLRNLTGTHPGVNLTDQPPYWR